MDHKNCQCNVGHHTQSPKFPFGPRHNHIFPECEIRNPCEFQIIHSGLHQKFWSMVCTTNKTFFKRFFTRFLTLIMASHTFFNPPSPINSLHFLKNETPSSFSSSLQQRCVSIVGLS